MGSNPWSNLSLVFQRGTVLIGFDSSVPLKYFEVKSTGNPVTVMMLPVLNHFSTAVIFFKICFFKFWDNISSHEIVRINVERSSRALYQGHRCKVFYQGHRSGALYQCLPWNGSSPVATIAVSTPKTYTGQLPDSTLGKIPSLEHTNQSSKATLAAGILSQGYKIGY